MVKKAILVALVSGFVFAATPEQIVVSLGGANSEVKGTIDENGNADIAKISQGLQEIGKLQILQDKKSKTILNFTSNASGALLLKSIETMLLNLGYGDYQNIKFINSPSSSYSVVVNLDKIPDPGEIYKELKKSYIFITNAVKNSANSYTYTLDMSKASIYATTFGTEYKKPERPYFINVSGKTSLDITVQSGDLWHPDIKIFDKELNLLDSKQYDVSQNSLNLALPSESYYIQVGDSSNLENIQKGLKFNLQ